MKNDFDGHDNRHFNNLFCYITGPAVDITTKMQPGHEDWFYNNTVVGTGLQYDLIARNTTVPPVVYDNRIFTVNGVATAARMPLSNGTTGACTINRPCEQQYVGKSQSCMFISGRLIVHAPVQTPKPPR